MLYCTLTGGEAMCHKDFFKIAAEVRRLGMALRVYSNGYLLADKKMVRRLKQLNPMEVEISLHGVDGRIPRGAHADQGFLRSDRFKESATSRDEGIKVNLKCPITTA